MTDEEERLERSLTSRTDENMSKIGARLNKPVSYTHLDVYKRQEGDKVVL